MPVGERFLDSNILLYSIASDEPAKHAIAVAIVADGLADGSAVISAQVVQECLNVVLRKPVLLTDSKVEDWLEDYLLPLCRHVSAEELIRRGLRIHLRYGFSYYDSCIVAAAVAMGCRTLLTEDLQHGQVVEGVMIRNPFLSP